jgi:hypothetical protein
MVLGDEVLLGSIPMEDMDLIARPLRATSFQIRPASTSLRRSPKARPGRPSGDHLSPAGRAGPSREEIMSRQESNDTSLRTSFLYGANAAYIEDLYANFQNDPGSVGPEWRQFFAGLADEAGLPERNARGASWQQPNWPVPLNGELVSALDGDWNEVASGVGEAIRARAATSAHAAHRRRGPPGDARFGARHHDDPGLPHARVISMPIWTR